MMDEKFSIEKNSSLANTNPEQYYFMQDQVMSVKAARKITQEKVGIYDYSAYGEKVISVNNPITNNIPVAGGIINSLLGTILPPATIPQTLQSNPAEEFGYTGREENNGVDGLMYYRNRYYSTKFKSFISEDPIGLAGGMNQYAYVEGNPVSFNDPLGLYSFSEFGGDVANGVVGFGDSITLGGTETIRNHWDIAPVDKSNAGYRTGDWVGFGYGLIMPIGRVSYIKNVANVPSIAKSINESYFIRAGLKKYYRGGDPFKILGWRDPSHLAILNKAIINGLLAAKISAGTTNRNWNIGIFIASGLNINGHTERLIGDGCE